jgi:hypothetical protein
MDFYDDTEGVLLKSKVPHNRLNQLVKEGQVLSVSERDSLPDRLFALIMDGPEGRMRKYACSDGTNTALSVIYFMENWKDLPASAVKTAASNLISFCDCYDMKPPKQLEKLSIGLPMALMLGAGAMHAGSKMEEGKGKAKAHLLRAGVKPKYSDLGMDEGDGDLDKEGSINPYVLIKADEPLARDVIDWEQATVEEPKLKLASLTDVYNAITYYKDGSSTWTPKEKVAYCRPLLERATQLGLHDELPLEITQYGNTKVANAEYISSMIELRGDCFNNDYDYYNYLRKVATISGEPNGDKLAEKLASVDREFHIDRYWGAEFPDPWRVVYGLVKTAGYEFEDGEKRISEDKLQKLAVDGRDKLLGHFNEDVVNEFQKNAVAIFDSLPLDHKRIIMNLAE